MGDVLRQDLVRQVNEAKVRVDAQGHALHDPSVGVRKAKVGSEDHDLGGHGGTGRKSRPGLADPHADDGDHHERYGEEYGDLEQGLVHSAASADGGRV